jgi:hypothetical protein
MAHCSTPPKQGGTVPTYANMDAVGEIVHFFVVPAQKKKPRFHARARGLTGALREEVGLSPGVNSGVVPIEPTHSSA